MVNREIKFRGICKNTRKFVYGNYIEKIDPTKESPTFWASLIHDRALTTTVVISDTVGQYTGLKDKNGKEIYEGDIFRVEEPRDEGGDDRYYLVITWVKEWFMFAFLNTQEYNQCLLQGDAKCLDEQMFWTYTLDDVQDSRYTLIGNIHENPELLNK